MTVDYLFRQSEAETVAFRLSREVGLEDGVGVLAGDAAAVVGDGEMDLAVAATHAEVEGPVLGERVEGVDDEVGDDLEHLAGEHLGGKLFGEILHETDLLRLDGAAMNAQGGFG